MGAIIRLGRDAKIPGIGMDEGGRGRQVGESKGQSAAFGIAGFEVGCCKIASIVDMDDKILTVLADIDAMPPFFQQYTNDIISRRGRQPRDKPLNGIDRNAAAQGMGA